MVYGESRQPGRKKISIFIFIIIIVVVLILIIIFVIWAVSTRTKTLKKRFIANCEKFGGYDCQQVWGAFEQAYVGRDKCDVPVEAYDPLIAAAPFKHDSSRTLLWSQTGDVFKKFAKERGLVTLADTLFGIVTEGYETWCGEKGSMETLTTDCPEASGCENSPLRSYWNRVSAAFSEYAQGDVTLLLSGSTETPFDPKRTLAKIELPALQPGRVTCLDVVLVTQKISKATCENPSLKILKNLLQLKGIAYTCTEIPEYDCPKVWDAFEQAYGGRNECDVPMEAYDPVFALAPFRHDNSRTLLWSNCEKFVADFNDKKQCFEIMKDTVLGAAVADLNWYGKEGSKETFNASHQEWKDCENYTVKSFWRGYSAKFAEAAEGQVTAMLNGSSDPPLKPTSIFASIEVPRLNPTKVQSLNVVLVTPETSVVDCTHPSFTDLRQELKPGIKFNCKEVPESQIQECKNNKEKSCEACW